MNETVHMVDESNSSSGKPLPRHSHLAVQIHRHIVIFGGYYNMKHISHKVIWTYNLDIDRWKKHIVSGSQEVPQELFGACAMEIGTQIYMHGGSTIEKQTLATLWKLDVSPALWKMPGQDGIVWSQVMFEDNNLIPSARSNHTGWEHSGKIWIFGGYGDPFHGFLAEHGEYWPFRGRNTGFNNQLHTFNPNTSVWMNVQSTGTIPSPRAAHSTAKLNRSIFMYGGKLDTLSNELFELNLESLVWTQIQTNGPETPKGRYRHSFTDFGQSHIVLYGGFSSSKDCSSNNPTTSTWIFDIISQSWHQHIAIKDHARACHTATATTCGIFIFGGTTKFESYSTVINISLEPKTLEKLSLEVVYRQPEKWHVLPRKFQGHLTDMEELSKPDENR